MIRNEAAASPTSFRTASSLVALCFTALLVSHLASTGFLETDDLYYAGAARGWLDNGLYLASSHWGLRHLIVLPIALTFKMLGVGEQQLLLPSMLYFVGLVAMTFVVIDRWYGREAGVFSGFSLLCAPLLVATSTTVFADLPEAFWIISSFYCFLAARTGASNHGVLIASGVLAGAAWITRETTLAYVLFLGLCFLVAPGMPRGRYFLIGAGFLLVVAVDTALLWLASGDPMYRYTVTIGGVQADDPRTAVADEAGAEFDRHGNFLTARWLLPIAMLFLQQKFGILYLLAVPLWIWLCFSGSISAHLRTTARLLAGLAITWFVTLSYVLTSLWIQNRYQTVPTIAAAVVIGLGIAALYRRQQRRLAVVIATAAVANCVLMLSLENRDLMFGEKALVEWASEFPEQIATDSKTRSTALFLLEAAGLAGRVHTGDPSPKGLYFYNSSPRRGIPADRAVPQPNWIVVKTLRSPGRPIGRLLSRLGVLQLLPEGVALKISPPPRQAVLYRVP